MPESLLPTSLPMICQHLKWYLHFLTSEGANSFVSWAAKKDSRVRMQKLNCRPWKTLLRRYLAKVRSRWLRIHPSTLSDQACTPRNAGRFGPVLWDVGREVVKAGMHRIQAPAYNLCHFPSFHANLNWGDSSEVCMDMSMFFPSTTIPCSHSSFLVHWPSWYMKMRKSQSVCLETCCQTPYFYLLMVSHQRI